MKNNILHRKDRLIITTIEIMDELGYQGLSTREIAKREGVSEATIFRHYKNKNELLMAVLDYFTQFDHDIYASTKLKGLKPKDAIQYYIRSTVEYYENYPAITAIMQMLDVLRYEQKLTDKVQNIIYTQTQFINLLVEEAQRGGEIRKEVDSGMLTDLITGVCREICLKWRFADTKFSLKEKTISAIDLLLENFK